MRKLRLSRAQLADRAGISRGYVSDLLNGKRGGRMGAEVMLGLANALEVEPLFFAERFANASKKRRYGRISDKQEVADALPQ